MPTDDPKKPAQPIRRGSPSRVVRDKAVARFVGVSRPTPSPVSKVWPDTMVATLAKVAGTTRPRIYRWLNDPDKYALTWPELVDISGELGATIRVLFSDKCH